jgi:hypothetical protein
MDAKKVLSGYEALLGRPLKVLKCELMILRDVFSFAVDS